MLLYQGSDIPHGDMVTVEPAANPNLNLVFQIQSGEVKYHDIDTCKVQPSALVTRCETKIQTPYSSWLVEIKYFLKCNISKGERRQ